MIELERIQPSLLVAYENENMGNWAITRVQQRVADKYGFTEEDCLLGHWAMTRNDKGHVVEMTTHGINFGKIEARHKVRFFRHCGIVTPDQQRACVKVALQVALGNAEKRHKYDWALIVNEWLASYGLENDFNIASDLICTEYPYAIWIAYGLPIATDNYLPAMAGPLVRSGRLEEVRVKGI